MRSSRPPRAWLCKVQSGPRGESPTVAQQVLGLLGQGEVQRARGEAPVAARRALERSQALGFGFGEVHAAITLGLAGAISTADAEGTIRGSRFSPPERADCDGLLRYCLGPEPELHAISFP